MKVDTHTHSRFSHDGRDEIETMVQTAKSKGAGYIALTDHCDMDVLQEGVNVPNSLPQLDMDTYFAEIKRVRSKIDGIYIAFGIETGYDSRANELYKEIIAKYPLDIVINSVHFVDGENTYFEGYFKNKTKQFAYDRYLEAIYDSLLVDYHYDIVGHIGYFIKNSPYDDPVIYFKDHAEILDKIFKKIIELDKALEVNMHNVMVPNIELMRRYFELGGRKISYGSDAHRGEVLKDYDKVSDVLREIGFTHYSIFKRDGEQKVKI